MALWNQLCSVILSDLLLNKKKLLGCVRAFDRHCNMVLENVREMWTKVCMSRRTGFWRKLSGKDIVTLKFQFFWLMWN
ncbi:hypothetical protein RHSIM_Rhsim06G0047400 [Rhododendron simsii]|uniref:Small nuclear ribonucleoprotein Sm D2 n=1 Tax=Rhododendron simsii TaxID=118357 RepID=A0A834GS57_RHOSS|nr:hypothetical protein RHSIM_Rhsim06G0047400 [Rhododendron simsii]